MTYNLTFLNSSTPNPADIAVGINDNTNGLLFGGLYFALFIIIFMYFSDRNTPDALLGTSIIMAIIAGIMWGLKLIPGWNIVLALSIVLIAIINNIMNKSK